MKLTINSISKRKYTGPVFNMEVTPRDPIQDDQYYVNSETGLVVHNCHPRDNIALRFLAERLDLGYDLFHAIMHSRDKQAENMAMKLVQLAKQHNLPIVIHGRAYKPYVPYTIGSYSELVGHFVEQAGISVRYSDPLTGDNVEDGTVAVVLMAHNPVVTYEGTGVEIKPEQLYYKFGEGSVVLDPWRTVLKISGCEIVQYGNTRKK